MTTRATPITIRGLRKAYGSVIAMDDLDIDIAAGEFLTLLGPSGSGKTTVLMTLAGFIRPDRGSIQVDGREIVRAPPHKRDIGMVFQNYALFPHMDVGENVAFPLRLRGVGRAEREERARRVLGLVKLEGLTGRRVSQLSGGQRQRVALARAIVFEPTILLMDEPLSALDKKLREEMQIELRHLHERIGMTTVYVTHDQREALTLSDRIAVLNQGRLVQAAPPRELYERPLNRFVADFIGESSFLAADYVPGEGGRLGGRILRLATEPPPGSGGYALVLRPEKLEIVTPGTADDYNRFEGTVSDVLYQGEQVVVRIDLSEGGSVAVRKGTRMGVLMALPAVGDRITVGLHPEDTILVPESSG